MDKNPFISLPWQLTSTATYRRRGRNREVEHLLCPSSLLQTILCKSICFYFVNSKETCLLCSKVEVSTWIKLFIASSFNRSRKELQVGRTHWRQHFPGPLPTPTRTLPYSPSPGPGSLPEPSAAPHRPQIPPLADPHPPLHLTLSCLPLTLPSTTRLHTRQKTHRSPSLHLCSLSS